MDSTHERQVYGSLTWMAPIETLNAKSIKIQPGPSILSDRKKKSHKKVRSGCATCRERRIKCDETKPICRRCIQSGYTCKGYKPPKDWLVEFGRLRPPQNLRKIAPDISRNSETSSELELVTQLPVFNSFSIRELREYYASSQSVQATELDTLIEYTFSIWGPHWIWRPLTCNREHSRFRAVFVQGLLREPALLEAVFAVMSSFVPLKDQTVQQSQAKSLFHFGRAVRLLRKRIDTANAAYDDAVFWTIFALLLIQQEIGDWKGFRVNLAGMQKVVTLRGGVQVIRDDCVRASMFLRWAENCVARHENSDIPVSTTALLYRRQETDNLLLTTIDPILYVATQFQGFEARRLISNTLLGLIGRTAYWFEHHVNTEYTSKEQSYGSGRAELAQDLDGYLQNSCALQHDYLVATALLLLVASHPPFGMLETHPDIVNGVTEAVIKVPNENIDSSCLLWVGLIVASLPVGYGVSPTTRWKLLVDYALQAPADMTWDQASEVVVGFWKPSSLNETWPGCWHVATMRAESMRNSQQKDGHG